LYQFLSKKCYYIALVIFFSNTRDKSNGTTFQVLWCGLEESRIKIHAALRVRVVVAPKKRSAPPLLARRFGEKSSAGHAARRTGGWASE
jgi:hypothetical protein